jgi:hypothetical protein
MTSTTMDETNMLSDGQGFVNADNVNGHFDSHGQSLVGCFHASKSVNIEDGVATAAAHKVVPQVINYLD